MQNNNNPVSPHLEIYKWQISSLLSIAHRIVGATNILAITLICIWTLSLLVGENSYEITKLFLKSLFGKFIIVSLCWTFSFHILNEIRHLVWDMGYGFDYTDYDNAINSNKKEPHGWEYHLIFGMPF